MVDILEFSTAGGGTHIFPPTPLPENLWIITIRGWTNQYPVESRPASVKISRSEILYARIRSERGPLCSWFVVNRAFDVIRRGETLQFAPGKLRVEEQIPEPKGVNLSSVVGVWKGR